MVVETMVGRKERPTFQLLKFSNTNMQIYIRQQQYPSTSNVD